MVKKSTVKRATKKNKDTNKEMVEDVLPNFEDLSALDMTYLLKELIEEVRKRQVGSKKVVKDMDAKTFEFTHDIELNGGLNQGQKANYYDMMEQHYKDRRVAKMERMVIDNIFGDLDWRPNIMLNHIEKQLCHKKSYFNITTGEKMVEEERWSSFYDNQYKEYL